MLTQLKTNILDKKSNKIKQCNFLIESRLIRNLDLKARIENIIVSNNSKPSIKNKRRFD
ncbi:MAG: hypothetical protein QXO35_02130 [Candidatus Micrarchaeia archaeon]